MACITLAALACATFRLLAVTRAGTGAEASRPRPDNNKSTYGDDKLTGNSGVFHSDTSHFVQTNYWYPKTETTITGCFTTTNTTLQAVFGPNDFAPIQQTSLCFTVGRGQLGSTCNMGRPRSPQRNVQRSSRW